MKKLNENLSEIFDIEPIEIKEKVTTDLVTIESGTDIDIDANFARENIKQLISSGNIALGELATVANQSESPRAYEVLATMMKNLADMNKDLLELQKRKRDLQPKETTQNLNIDKAVFVGSTTELLKMIKANK
jgi:K+-transporting ATPase c subunit